MGKYLHRFNSFGEFNASYNSPDSSFSEPMVKSITLENNVVLVYLGSEEDNMWATSYSAGRKDAYNTDFRNPVVGETAYRYLQPGKESFTITAVTYETQEDISKHRYHEPWVSIKPKVNSVSYSGLTFTYSGPVSVGYYLYNSSWRCPGLNDYLVSYATQEQLVTDESEQFYLSSDLDSHGAPDHSKVIYISPENMTIDNSSFSVDYNKNGIYINGEVSGYGTYYFPSSVLPIPEEAVDFDTNIFDKVPPSSEYPDYSEKLYAVEPYVYVNIRILDKSTGRLLKTYVGKVRETPCTLDFYSLRIDDHWSDVYYLGIKVHRGGPE